VRDAQAGRIVNLAGSGHASRKFVAIPRSHTAFGQEALRIERISAGLTGSSAARWSPRPLAHRRGVGNGANGRDWPTRPAPGSVSPARAQVRWSGRRCRVGSPVPSLMIAVEASVVATASRCLGDGDGSGMASPLERRTLLRDPEVIVPQSTAAARTAGFGRTARRGQMRQTSPCRLRAESHVRDRLGTDRGLVWQPIPASPDGSTRHPRAFRDVARPEPDISDAWEQLSTDCSRMI
jgi:hypothetical protein